jgi:hypothetical protein
VQGTEFKSHDHKKREKGKKEPKGNKVQRENVFNAGTKIFISLINTELLKKKSAIQ